MKKGTIFFLLLSAFWNITSIAQIGPYADSLQIKTYVVIDYKEYKPKKITVKKIFCDYCNAAQLHYVKFQAWDWAYSVRKSPDNVLPQGQRKLTFLLRVAKKDLQAIREQETTIKKATH